MILELKWRRIRLISILPQLLPKYLCSLQKVNFSIFAFLEISYKNFFPVMANKINMLFDGITTRLRVLFSFWASVPTLPHQEKSRKNGSELNL